MTYNFNSEPNLRGKVVVQTHGCKLNQSDSETIARQFSEAGYEPIESVADADVYVLNTCTVTANADAKARQALRAARRINPNAIIVATGCYPQRAAEDLQKLDCVSLVINNSTKHDLVTQTIKLHQQSSDYQSRKPQAPSGLLASNQSDIETSGIYRTRAMIKIQEGCNQICAYCIVPKVRGRERSISTEYLIRQIVDLQNHGYQEIVLTGTQLGSYGFDLPNMDLTGLLERILLETDIPRIRVSSLQPQEITPALLSLWDNSRLCPHFHIPLQSGATQILQDMRRKYTTQLYAQSVDLIRSRVKNPGITTDLILGFPGEDDSLFCQTLEFIQHIQFSDMHVFPYSRRPGTTAYYYENCIDTHTKKTRTKLVLNIAEQQFNDFRQRQIGTVRPVLWESKVKDSESNVWSGLTDNYIRIYSENATDLKNHITNTRLLGFGPKGLIGQVEE